MSIDRRLRQGFERSAIVVDPDPRVTIADAVSRGKRRKRLANSARATAVIVLVALISLIASQLLRGVYDRQPATKTPPPPIAPEYTEIAGTYAAKIERHTGPPASDMVGTWSLDLSTDGVLVLVPPSGSAFPTSPATFQVQDRRFQTDALATGACAGTFGTYTWALSAGHLRFTKIEDRCPVRVTLFAARQWQSLSPGGSATGANPVIPDDGSTLEPGTYAAAFQPRIQLSVTEGWTGNNDTSDWLEIRLGRSDADGALDFFQIQSVLDPETQQTIPLPQDLVGWFTSHPALDILSPPQSTTIGGVQATQFDVALAPDWHCGHPGCVGFASLLPGEGFGWSSVAAPHLRSRIFVLRVQGSTVIATFASARSRFQEGVRAAEAVLGTVEFP